jgi:5'-3' exonuclease
MSYETLFKDAGISKELYHKNLEADDCIAITTTELLKDPNNQITIITSDTDYLQLIQQRVSVYSLKLKKINTEKNSTGCSKQDLFYKIILGDKSDNIPKVFNKCGKKTVEKYWNDANLITTQFNKEEGSFDRFINNKKLIDFNMIPINLKQEYLELNA